MGESGLSNTQLKGTDLSGAVLQGGNLGGVELFDTRLQGADMRWAKMEHLEVDLALEFVDLTGVLLEGALFKHGVRSRSFPEKGGRGCAAR
ncbi:MAG: pentapeptide repeat-containing protein [Gammaproteobacteria bacterium]|nr:pentapeptide repeat-containing protein [Gammaproteobacteria bacterium]